LRLFARSEGTEVYQGQFNSTGGSFVFVGPLNLLRK
jgi:hypothetical protein